MQTGSVYRYNHITYVCACVHDNVELIHVRMCVRTCVGIYIHMYI